MDERGDGQEILGILRRIEKGRRRGILAKRNAQGNVPWALLHLAGALAMGRGGKDGAVTRPWRDTPRIGNAETTAPIVADWGGPFYLKCKEFVQDISLLAVLEGEMPTLPLVLLESLVLFFLLAPFLPVHLNHVVQFYQSCRHKPLRFLG